MYVYLYDSALKERSFQSKLKSIENRLTDIGITGKIIRLTALNNSPLVLTEEIKRGAKTVIVVGKDETLASVIAHSGAMPVTFGFIPLEHSVFGTIMGLGEGVEACDVISARKIEPLDVGWMNNRYFLGQVEIAPAEIEIDYDHMFHVGSKGGKLGVTITNMYPFVGKTETKVKNANPQDGRMEAFVQPVTKKSGMLRSKETVEAASVFPFKEMVIAGHHAFSVFTDGRESKEIKLNIRLSDSKLKMIVGKSRKF